MNKEKGLRVLRSRIFNMEREKQLAEQSAARQAATGSGNRSEKVRTYNYPQDRVTDHRIGENMGGIDRFMKGLTLEQFHEGLWRKEANDYVASLEDNSSA